MVFFFFFSFLYVALAKDLSLGGTSVQSKDEEDLLEIEIQRKVERTYKLLLYISENVFDEEIEQTKEHEHEHEPSSSSDRSFDSKDEILGHGDTLKRVKEYRMGSISPGAIAGTSQTNIFDRDMSNVTSTIEPVVEEV